MQSVIVDALHVAILYMLGAFATSIAVRWHLERGRSEMTKTGFPDEVIREIMHDQYDRFRGTCLLWPFALTWMLIVYISAFFSPRG